MPQRAPLLLVATALVACSVDAFSIPINSLHLQNTRISSTSLFIKPDWFASDADEDEDNPEMVTREMLHRDLLGDPQVRRKRKNGKGEGYKPLDNRDHLPFAVEKITPDPYTHPETKTLQAKKCRPTRNFRFCSKG